MTRKKSLPVAVPSALISRLPYAPRWDVDKIKAQALRVAERGIVCVSAPLHVDHPLNGAKLFCQLEEAGLHCVAVVSWHRDRHIVTSRSTRLTNAWEPVGIFSRSKDWYVDRDGPARPRRGVEGREEQFDQDTFTTCAGDHWPIRCDRRDRRLLPAAVVLQLVQLAGLSKGDIVLDPWGNPGVREECGRLGLLYEDSGLASELRADWARGRGKGKENGKEEAPKEETNA